MKLRPLLRILYSKIYPLKYARKVGIQFSEGELHLFGKIAWGSEPWLISFGKNVYITDGVKFITHDGGTLLYRNIVPDLEITKPIKVGSNVYFGNNVIVLGGVTIGNNVVIGAGSVITKDIEDNSVVVGIPGRKIKTADEYFEKIKKESIHLGNYTGQEKDKKLMEYYNYKGKSNGIYF